MPIDPAELATSIGTLYRLDLDRGLAQPCSRSSTRPRSWSGQMVPG
jgi:hypothetical protein